MPSVVSACLLANKDAAAAGRQAPKAEPPPPPSPPTHTPTHLHTYTPPTCEARWLWQMTTPSGGLKPPPTSASHFSIWTKPLPAEQPDCLEWQRGGGQTRRDVQP